MCRVLLLGADCGASLPSIGECRNDESLTVMFHYRKQTVSTDAFPLVFDWDCIVEWHVYEAYLCLMRWGWKGGIGDPVDKWF